MKATETTDGNGSAQEAIAKRSPVCFLIPTYKTPLLTSDLLHAALQAGVFEDCLFALLLDASDPQLIAYKTLIDSVREKGLKAGFFVFDGTPYCGMVNRVAPIIDACALCVLDSQHLPMPKEGERMADAVSRWFGASPEPMKVGTFSDDGFYPVVTQKLVDRLGYMFHPLSVGRVEAENWLLDIASACGILARVDGCRIMESKADAVEIVGRSTDEDVRWVGETLEQTLDDVRERIESQLVR